MSWIQWIRNIRQKIGNSCNSFNTELNVDLNSSWESHWPRTSSGTAKSQNFWLLPYYFLGKEYLWLVKSSKNYEIFGNVVDGKSLSMQVLWGDLYDFYQSQRRAGWPESWPDYNSTVISHLYTLGPHSLLFCPTEIHSMLNSIPCILWSFVMLQFYFKLLLSGFITNIKVEIIFRKNFSLLQHHNLASQLISESDFFLY